MSEILYRAEGLTKQYPRRSRPAVALDEPLMIPRGEIFTLVGPSGAGKSTLLRMLGLIEPPSTGMIELLGTRVDAQTPPSLALRRRVVLVFQRPILLSGSVADNVAYGLRVRGCRGVRRLVDRVLEQVGLAALKHVPAHTLSGGEAQRVALARALVVQPDVFLMDEPTANLDPGNVALIEQIIQVIHGEQRTSIVLVTHNIFQAQRLAERVGLMLNGKLIEVGPREQFFARPRDPRTRAFVNGEMIY